MIDYQILKWDSNFFGINVAKITVVNFTKQLKNLIIELEKEGTIGLIYVFSKNKIIDEDCFLSKYNGNLVDEKIFFLKDRLINHSKNINVTEFEQSMNFQSLISLAIQSGKYSRFNVDKNIKKNDFIKLYEKWITNSVEKKICDSVLIYKKEKKIVGFITLKRLESRVDIGLIAVDHNYRGKGIGQILMKSAEKWALERQINTIQVVTQIVNVPACLFYKKNKYKIKNIEYIYHFWLNK